MDKTEMQEVFHESGRSPIIEVTFLTNPEGWRYRSAGSALFRRANAGPSATGTRSYCYSRSNYRELCRHLYSVAWQQSSNCHLRAKTGKGSTSLHLRS